MKYTSRPGQTNSIITDKDITTVKVFFYKTVAVYVRVEDSAPGAMVARCVIEKLFSWTEKRLSKNLFK